LKKILCIVGARPNFIKAAALYRAFKAFPAVAFQIVHTGQHHDTSMSDVFFRQLQLPRPDHYLNVSGGSATQRIAQTLLALEAVFERERPDLIVVIGDVNSTLTGALAASKAQIPLAHVEAGLRSGDRRMPEESNRIVTDHLSDYLFVTEQAGFDNLQREGIPPEKVFFTGNCLIDSLVHYRHQANKLDTLERLGLQTRPYVLMTLHRPSNVDTRTGLEKILRLIELCATQTRVVFPVHPRTRATLEQFGLSAQFSSLQGLLAIEPQGYLEFLQLLDHAAAVITDSGGVQEESTFLQIPCLTFRENTERPVTVELGTNELLAELDPVLVLERLHVALAGDWKKGVVPPLWDGKAGERIAEVLSSGRHLCRVKSPPAPPRRGGM